MFFELHDLWGIVFFLTFDAWSPFTWVQIQTGPKGG